jgi:hypothetical protein
MTILCFMLFSGMENILITGGAAVGKLQKFESKMRTYWSCYMAVFSNSPIDDNIIRYLALRSLLLHDYFLSFDTYKYLTFCFDLDF